VASERGAVGARLVALDDGGNRTFDLIATARDAGPLRESNPTVSPDGRWVVFASSREGDLHQTKLWIAPLEADAVPRRLNPRTPASAIESHPAWTSDGRAVVYASTIAGTFDLWRVPVTTGVAGTAVALTDAGTHELTPALAPDGSIAFAVVSLDGASHLALRAPDGQVSALTAGPSDVAPTFSPDGAQLLFARPVAREGGLVDGDLFTMRPHPGAEPTRLLDAPFTDESGPVMSADGRFVFATSVLRGEADRVLFSSIVHVDLTETPRVLRVLTDRLGATLRLTPAVVVPHLDPTALHADPEYGPELKRIMEAMIEAQTAESP